MIRYAMVRYTILACLMLMSLWLVAGAGEAPPPRENAKDDARNRDAGEHPDAQARNGHEAADEQKEADDEDDKDDEDNDDDEENIFLGRTYKFRFELVPLEDDDEPHWLLVATRQFGYELNFSNDREGMHFEVEGQLYPIAGKPQVLMVYHVNLGFRGNDGKGNVRAFGSAVVKLGQDVLLTALGDRSLKVKVIGVDKVEKRTLAKPGAKEEIF